MKYKYENLLNKTISITINGFKNIESYSGILKENGEDFVVLDLNNPKKEFKYSHIILDVNLIRSILVYK